MNQSQPCNIIETVTPTLFFVKLLKAYYEREAVFAAAYKFQSCFHIKIDSYDDSYVGVWFQVKPGQEPETVKHALGDFCNETLDQQVRLDLDKRFGHLREAVYEKAFRPLDDSKGVKS